MRAGGEYGLALDSLAKQIPAHPYESFVLGTFRYGTKEPDFQLHVQDERDLPIAAKLWARMCAIAPTFGIVGDVRFAITSGNINGDPKKQRGFSCRRGEVAG